MTDASTLAPAIWERQDERIRYPAFERIGRVVAGTTTRHFAREGEDKPALLARLAAALGQPVTVIARGKQVHGCDIGLARSTSAGAAGDAPPLETLDAVDALVTDQPAALLTTTTADCVPVIVADTAGARAAVCHAGWRGAKARIVERAIDRLVELGAARYRLAVQIGPAISQANYEVSPDLAAEFAAEFPDCPAAVDGRHLDLPALNRHQAERAGVPPDHILDCEICTFDNTDFCESYRREQGTAGRMVTFVLG